jgi:hypothetical protein
MNRWRVGENRGSKETDGCPLTPSNSSASSSLYSSAFVGCWWDLRRDSLFSYLYIILVLGVFQGLCGVRIITTGCADSCLITLVSKCCLRAPQ